MYSFLERKWSNSRRRLKVGKIRGSYFKQAPKEPTKVFRDFWLATDTFVLVYSQLEQNELLLFHVEKNGLLNGLLDTTYERDI